MPTPKKGTTAPPAPPAEETSTVIATIPASDLPATAAQFGTLDGYKADDSRGKEGITSEDLRLPFLSLAQKTSKALDETEDAHIEGLTFGDMYNSELKTVYGKTAIEFIPLSLRKRAYIPDANGRMGESIAWDDPRCDWPSEEQKKSWTTDGKKGKPKPEGVRVMDFVVLLVLEEGPQLAVISFKSKSFGAGQSLATFISMTKGPSFTSKYKVGSVLDTNDAGKFAKFAVQPAGKPTAEMAQFAEAMYESVRGKKIATEDPEGTTDEPAAGTVVEGTVVGEKKDAPF